MTAVRTVAPSSPALSAIPDSVKSGGGGGAGGAIASAGGGAGMALAAGTGGRANSKGLRPPSRGAGDSR